MPVLNLAGCPIGTRFVVMKITKSNFWTSQVVKVHSYIGPIELDQLFKKGKLHGCRVYLRPRGGSEHKYNWEEPPIGEMWNEGLNMTELMDYLNYE